MIHTKTLRSAEWTEFPAPPPQEPGLVRILRRPDTPGRAELLRRVSRNEMTQPYIVETNTERRLHFSWECTQSAMQLDDPSALSRDYTRKMMAFLLLNPLPRKILMLGLGGGALPKFCYSRLPPTDITVVEINEDVIALRDEFCVPRDDERFRVVHADGGAYMSQIRDPVDVILVDAFDPTGISRSLPASQFYSRAVERLTDNGVLVMNFWGDHERYVDNLTQVVRAFGKNLRLVPTMTGGNLVLFASRRSATFIVSKELESLSKRLQKTLNLDFPRYLRRICNGASLFAN
jgi:spermidine synthase